MDSTYIQICIGHFREQVSVRAEPGKVSVGMGELRCLLSSGPAATRAELSRAAGRCAQTQLAPRGSPATPSSEKHFSISTQLCCQGGASSSIPASYMPAPRNTDTLVSIQSPRTQQWRVTRLPAGKGQFKHAPVPWPFFTHTVQKAKLTRHLQYPVSGISLTAFCFLNV